MKIIIELHSYNVEDAALIIARQLFVDMPFLTKKEFSEKLGISERTIYRWQLKYGDDFCNTPRTIKPSTAAMINHLQTQGYKISK